MKPIDLLHQELNLVSEVAEIFRKQLHEIYAEHYVDDGFLDNGVKFQDFRKDRGLRAGQVRQIYQQVLSLESAIQQQIHSKQSGLE